MGPSVRNLIEYDVKNPAGAGTSMEEKLFIYGLLAQSGFERVLEIGVSRGHMTAWMGLAQCQNGCEMVSVDNYSRAHGGEAINSDYAERRLSKNEIYGTVDFIVSDSLDYLKEQPDNSFGMVWVDGDHSYEGALADIREAMRVAEHIVGVHDTCQQYDGPRKACEKIEEEMGVNGFWVGGRRGIWVCNVIDEEYEENSEDETMGKDI
ncbi:class I SAM-dependent methyltransferase [Candidatus Pacearchaeota archaeon]|nr:class I SAM-dependent methyltransferase [Candidatus Pacearchaeota archaeon]